MLCDILFKTQIILFILKWNYIVFLGNTNLNVLSYLVSFLLACLIGELILQHSVGLGFIVGIFFLIIHANSLIYDLKKT